MELRVDKKGEKNIYSLQEVLMHHLEGRNEKGIYLRFTEDGKRKAFKTTAIKEIKVDYVSHSVNFITASETIYRVCCDSSFDFERTINFARNIKSCNKKLAEFKDNLL